MIRKVTPLVFTAWAVIVTSFLGWDDDRAARVAMLILTVPAVGAIVAFMIAEHRRTWGAKITHERI